MDYQEAQGRALSRSKAGNTQDLYSGKKMQDIRPVGIAVHSGKSYSC